MPSTSGHAETRKNRGRFNDAMDRGDALPRFFVSIYANGCIAVTRNVMPSSGVAHMNDGQEPMDGDEP